MKLSNSNSALVVLMVVVFAITSLSAQKDPGQKTIPKQSTTDWTEYYWFDDCGTYIGQNTIDDEINLTEFDEMPYPPMTLKERGYAPVYCTTGNPPIPLLPFFPQKRLYTHP